MDAPVELRDLSFAFGEGALRRPVLRELSLSVSPGEIVLLTGPSGSGKTTLLTLIGALRAMQQGSCRVLGQELMGATEVQRVALRRRIGFIFQHHNLLGFLTARQNVAMALELDPTSTETGRLDQAAAILGQVGLSDYLDAMPSKLSGGQRQRVAIARALVANPGLVLADEPTAALDRQTGHDVVHLMRDMARRTGTPILLVTHDPRILGIADRVIAMEDGRITEPVGVTRRTDLDALRIVLCASVILQHAVLIFAAEPRYHVKSIDPVAWTTIVYEALRIFAMPPFFAIAGWSAVVSLRRRAAPAFARERLLRLGVPLLAGIVLLGPAIKYIELTQGRDLGLAGFRLVPPIAIDFLSFLPKYYTRIVLNTWSHLWFIAYLLIYCVIFLPILVRLARLRTVDAAPGAWVVYLPALPLAGVMALFNGYWPYLPNLVQDWTNFSYFALCFLAGAMIAVWPGFERRLWTQTQGMAVLAALGFAGVIWFGESTAGRFAVGLTAWGFVGVCWALAHRFAPPWSERLRVLSEATLPVYIIHHVPLLLIALWVLPLGWPVWLSILVIAGLDTVVSVGVYVVLVRPWRPVRWLMGMAAERGA